jgi:hypothetical protein
VLPIEDVERMLAMSRTMGQETGDTACIGDLLRAAGVLTWAGLGEGDDFGEEAAVLIAGDLRAADLAACITTVVPALGPGAPPTPDAQGRYAIGRGGEVAVLADLPGGGVVAGTPAAVDAVLAADPAAGTIADAPLLARLRTLLGGGGGDVEAYLLRAMSEEAISVSAAGFTLRRGAADRYEIVLVTPSPDDAGILSLIAAGAPLAVARFEAELAERGEDLAGSPPGDVIVQVLPKLAAIREALDVAQITAEGDVVRAVVEIDPTLASPGDLLTVLGMLVYSFGRAEAREMQSPPAPDLETYGIPGVPSADPGTRDQPPIE